MFLVSDIEPNLMDESDDEDVVNLKLEEIPLPPSTSNVGGAPEKTKAERSAPPSKKPHVREWDVGKPKCKFGLFILHLIMEPMDFQDKIPIQN